MRKLDIKKNLLRKRREMVKSLSLEVFKQHRNVALRGIVSGYGGDGSVVGLNDLGSLFQP